MDLLIIAVIFVVIWVIIEVLSVVFKLTGLEMSKARFQVISLITHTGFTTRESELISQHPTRRAIASSLMFISYIAQITLISVFLHLLTQNRQRLEVFAVVLVGVVVLIIFSTRNRYVSSRFNRFIEKILKRRVLRNMENQSVGQVLKIGSDYSIYEILVDGTSTIAGKTLAQSKLTEDYIQVLQVDHGSGITEFPKSTLVIEAGDKLIVYGKTESIIKRAVRSSAKNEKKK
ncbi:MAG: TrkA C-terminal domain-containing protein [Eubacteriales bacterium]